MGTSPFLLLSATFVSVIQISTENIEEEMSHITEFLNKTELLYMHEKLHKEQQSVDSLKLGLRRKVLLDSIKRLLPVQRAQTKSLDGDIETINENEGIGKFLYQGDIVLTKWQVDGILDRHRCHRRKRQAFRDKNYPRTIWPDGVVHFSFHPNASECSDSTHGALEWQRVTCLRFYEYNQGAREEHIMRGVWFA